MPGRPEQLLTQNKRTTTPSDLLSEVHVYILPRDKWIPFRKLASITVKEETISAGFVRVPPHLPLKDLREQLLTQLQIPQNYVFIKSVGRHFTQVKTHQEVTVKVKNFLPPLAQHPEIHILEYDESLLETSSSVNHLLPSDAELSDTGASSTGSLSSKLLFSSGEKKIYYFHETTENDEISEESDRKRPNEGSTEKHGRRSSQDSTIRQKDGEVVDGGVYKEKSSVLKKTRSKTRQRRIAEGRTSSTDADAAETNDGDTGDDDAYVNKQRPQRHLRSRMHSRRSTGSVSTGEVTQERENDSETSARLKRSVSVGRMFESPVIPEAHKKNLDELTTLPEIRKTNLPDKLNLRVTSEPSSTENVDRKVNQNNLSSSPLDFKGSKAGNLLGKAKLRESSSLKANEISETVVSESNLQENTFPSETTDTSNHGANLTKESARNVDRPIKFLGRRAALQPNPEEKSALEDGSSAPECSEGDTEAERSPGKSFCSPFEVSRWSPFGDEELHSKKEGGSSTSNFGYETGCEEEVKSSKSDDEYERNCGFERRHSRDYRDREHDAAVSDTESTFNMKRKQKRTRRRPNNELPLPDAHDKGPRPTKDQTGSATAGGKPRLTLQEIRQQRKESEDQRVRLFAKAKQLHEQIVALKEKRRQRWWEEYNQARRSGARLEERQSALRQELDSLHRKIMGSLARRTPIITGVKDEPSRKASLKITVIRLRHEIADMRRRLEAVDIKLQAEVKLRVQAEKQLKQLRTEVGKKKANVNMTRSKFNQLRPAPFIPEDILMRLASFKGAYQLQ